MVFVKVVKSKAYFKRYQVKYRRRREGKTDYRSRYQQVLQDKTKYGAPKYRLVVRFTNKDIVAQIIHAKIKGDDIICAAYAHELPAFGITYGLTNYAAAYATGLLLARRCLTKLKLADKFQGVADATGTYAAARTKKQDQGDEESQFPFKAILDIGLARTTTGARVFGVMKGVVDGGIAVPHRANRFPGFDKEKGELKATVHRDRIMGKHVADYIKKVKKSASEGEKVASFGKMIANNVAPESLEGIYKAAHKAIRDAPTKTIPHKAKPAGAGKPKSYRLKRISRAQKTENAKKKVAALRAKLGK